MKIGNGQYYQPKQTNPIVLSYLKTFKDFMSFTKNLNHVNLANCDINEDLGSELLQGFSYAK